MTLSEARCALVELQKKIRAFRHALDMLYYDSLTAAPSGSAQRLSHSLALLSEEDYRLLVCDKSAELLDFLYAHQEELDPAARAETMELRRKLERIRLIPVKEYADYERLRSDAQAAWIKAKYADDYTVFEPYLNRVIATCKRFAGYCAPDMHVYNVQLDGFQRGNTFEDLDSYFETYKKDIIPLTHAVSESGRVIDDSFLYQIFPLDKQAVLSRYIMEVMGLDHRYCVLAQSEHPRTMMFHNHDVRITTHYYETAFTPSMFSVLHEGGHALYELNIDDGLQESVLGFGMSLGMHEAQSRFYENIIGRSRGFIEFLFPKIHDLFPSQLKGVSAEQFYLAVNKAKAGLLRTQADELTYSTHILIRYELEKQLFNDTLTTRELPAAWNELYKRYLGVDVPSDAQGVLQDIHWSDGSYGSFPCYYLGNCYGAQYYSAMCADIGAEALIAAGNLAPITQWLTERIYRYGSLITPQDAIRNCCGEAFDPRCFNRYLTAKFRDLYQL